MIPLIGTILLWAGVFFMFVTAVGLLRLPDFYSRLHAASKTETLGMVLVMLGLGLHEGMSLVTVKLMMASIFILLASPTSAHLLARAAARLGQQPWTRTAARSRGDHDGPGGVH